MYLFLKGGGVSFLRRAGRHYREHARHALRYGEQHRQVNIYFFYILRHIYNGPQHPTDNRRTLGFIGKLGTLQKRLILGPEITACMSVVAGSVRRVLPRTIPVGVQVLAAANRSALAVALAADLQFIRHGDFC